MKDQHPQATTPAPLSDDGIYALADEPAAPTPTSNTIPVVAPGIPVVTQPSPAPTASGSPAAPSSRSTGMGGLLARFLRPRPISTPAAEPAGAAPIQSGGVNLRGRRPASRSLKQDLPAWFVSAVVHAGIFILLATATLAPAIEQAIVKTINSAPFDSKLAGEQADELVHILNEVTANERSEAAAPLSTSMTPGGMPGIGGGLGTGTGAPSATPALAGRGRGSAGGLGDGSLPNVKVGSQLSPIAANLPSTPTLDLGGGGMIGGDVTRTTDTIGEALDQLAAEILRQLADRKLTVVWLFDESGSMKDDQQAIKEKFDRVASELKLNVGEDRKAADALNHLIVGFGSRFDPILPKPTLDIDLIGRSIDRLPVDQTGIENTMQALQRVVGEFGKLASKDRRLMIILVTDESGDDGSQIEEARQMTRSHGIPVYVIGRQSLFGYDRAHLLYVDPVTKDHYWPAIRRGPESPAAESLQWDGLHERWDEQPSGFAPYELARIVKETGGIYFLLPSEENMRVRQREKAYSMKTLKEYVPDYASRIDYFKQRNESEFRRSLSEIVEGTRGFSFRRHLPVDIPALGQAIVEEGPIVQERLKQLVIVEQRLRALAKARDREPDRRWQAHYDLMLAQVITYQIKAYEYLACLKEMIALGNKGQLMPSKLPVKDQLGVDWVLDHSLDLKAPKSDTEKKIAEATRLLNEVIQRHPQTPWSDLAQDELNRGFGVQRNEWPYHPQYAERAKLVPKF